MQIKNSKQVVDWEEFVILSFNTLFILNLGYMHDSMQNNQQIRAWDLSQLFFLKTGFT